MRSTFCLSALHCRICVIPDVSRDTRSHPRVKAQWLVKGGWRHDKAFHILLEHYRGPGRRISMVSLSNSNMLMWHYIIWRVRGPNTESTRLASRTRL